jgi:polysaccharide deacetylase family protein (PEP-CTERM system associated)
MHNALTIDVEDYYHVSAFEAVVQPQDWERYESRVEKNTDKILALLAKQQVKATFFVLGWVAERYPNLVRRIAAEQHEVACHGYSHRRIYTQTPAVFRSETRKAKRLLEEAAGMPIVGYRAASYSITRQSLWALDILAEEGFQYDSSIFPIRHDLYGIPYYPRFPHVLRDHEGRPLVEFPLSTVRIAGVNFPVAGGGYLRLFPYAITHLAMRYLNKREKQPAIVYFHPWELDPEQPRMPARHLSRFRHYTNLSRMETKLHRLLDNFALAPIRDVFANYLFPKAVSEGGIAPLPNLTPLPSTRMSQIL